VAPNCHSVYRKFHNNSLHLHVNLALIFNPLAKKFGDITYTALLMMPSTITVARNLAAIMMGISEMSKQSLEKFFSLEKKMSYPLTEGAFTTH
jgi:hypothetical protein